MNKLITNERIYVCVCVCVCGQIQTLFWHILSLLNPLKMKINLNFLPRTKHTPYQLQTTRS